MEINNEELQKDLNEQYAMLEEEIQEDKKKKRNLIILICFLCLFLFMFGTTFSYYKIYRGNKQQQLQEEGLKDLYVDGYKDAYVFDPDIHEYVVFVAPKTTSVTIKYVLGCQHCRIEITGQNDLKIGENEVKVVVIHEDDGREEEYIIHIVVPEDDDNPSGANQNNNDERNLDLKSLSVKNHSLKEPFYHKKTSYMVDDIKYIEDIAEVSFELYDNRNKVELKINDSPVTRPIIKEGEIYKIWFDVKNELHLGANKLEIIVKDNGGNSKTYYLYLVVNKEEELEQKVVEIQVEYIDPTSGWNREGEVIVSEIIPGWESSKQEIRITNNSTYNTSIDINWSNISNSFKNSADLEYSLYKDDALIKTATLPTEDVSIITNVEIPANSVNSYYVSYRYIYRDVAQNEDQGKEFSGKINVSLTK